MFKESYKKHQTCGCGKKWSSSRVASRTVAGVFCQSTCRVNRWCLLRQVTFQFPNPSIQSESFSIWPMVLIWPKVKWSLNSNWKSLFLVFFCWGFKHKGILYNELSALGGTLCGDVFFEIGRVVIKLKRGIVLPCPALSVFFVAWLHPGQLTAGSPEFMTLSVWKGKSFVSKPSFRGFHVNFQGVCPFAHFFLPKDRIKHLDTGFMSCTMASPCHELSWQLVAEPWRLKTFWSWG